MRRERWMGVPIALPIVMLLAAATIVRSLVFVCWPAAHFDSDQAVTGLMAKHLSELRAFPVFWYGQTYMLGVEAWLAAPFMRVLGATVTALKLPLLIINVVITVLLFRGLTRDGGLGEWRAAVATPFFFLAAPMTAAHYLTANGGNVEPAFYVLLIWFLRRRPLWAGLVLGIGFLNREFTIYAIVALLILEALHRTLLTRDRLVHYGTIVATAAAVWMAVMVLRGFSSAAGPGTSMADLSTQLASNNLTQVMQRLCLHPAAIVSGVANVATVHWPELFGLESQPLTDFGIESHLRQGLTGAAWVLVPVLLIPIGRLVQARPGRDAPFCSYLMVVALMSITGYLAGRCGVIDFYTMRYELLSPLGAVGFAGWYLQRERSSGIRMLWVLSCTAVFVLSASTHARLIAEYATSPPVPAKRQLIQALEQRGVRYAYADYWTAYYVTFMTRERIIVASTEIVKVRSHNREVDTHRNEAIVISRQACPDGQPLTPAFWACRP